MKKKFSKSIMLGISICTLFFLMSFNTNMSLTTTKISIEKNDIENLKLSTTFDSTEINDFPGSLNNWSWAKSQGICNGSGTQLDPYVIDGHIFHPTMNNDCLRILNSRKYFTITNCIFRFAPTVFSGIFIANTTNGEISNNEFYDSMYGIYGLSIHYNVISENHIYSNFGDGIYLNGSNINTISNNNLSSNGWQGMWMQYSANNILTGNIANENNMSGLYLYSCDDNNINDNILNNNTLSGLTIYSNTDATVSDNEIKENGNEGIYFYDNLGSNIIRNNIQDNGVIGIYAQYSNQSIITENIVSENSGYGIYMGQYTTGNTIFLNCFNNTFNANDNGTYNQWDNGIKGNYWDDYTGLDTDNNGIGDAPYNITGSSTSQDDFPLIQCPLPLTGTGGGIPGYNLLFLLGILSMLSILTIKKMKKS